MEIIEGELKRILKDDYTWQTDKCRPVLNIDKNYKIKIASRKDFKVSTNTNKIKVYTDGSKNEKEHTGYGLCVDDPCTKKTLEEKGPLHTYKVITQSTKQKLTL